jgi:cysteinyl-tRNA synthetase
VRLTNRLLENPESDPDYLAFLAHLQHDLTSLGYVLNLLQADPAETLATLRQKPWELAISPEEIDELITRRTEARQNKDFATADKIRNELTEKGILLEDTPQGTLWRVKG